SNSSLTQLMTAIQQSIGNGCNGAINQMLFTTGGGQTAGWNQFLSNLEQGTISGCGAADSGFTALTTLTPGCITLAQSFLNYWGSVEYEQATMVTDYENYLSTVGNQSGVETAQNTYLGTSSSTSCQATPSLANLSANSTVSSFCQDQQNIADVWPQNLYSDELLYVSGSIPGLTGFAVTAVPASYGTTSNSAVGPTTILLQSGCGASTSCFFDVGSSWVSNQLALSSWNQEVAATPSSSLLQSPYVQPQVAYSAISGLDPGSMDASVATFLTSWLDAFGTEPCASNCAPWVINGSQSNVLYGFCEYLYDGSAQVLWNSNVGWQNCAPTVVLGSGQDPVFDGIVAFLNPLNVVSNVYSVPGLNEPYAQLPASPQVSLLMQRDWSQGSPWPVFSATTSN
ncbi:MAG: hypothetical protein NT160_03615, partial [Actinobacteria bacterium]|nr:hypothetical protein [Actinomycetota bacterium]